MNTDIKFLNREWRKQYFLINFEDYFWIACLSYFYTPICVVSSTFVGSSDPKPLPNSSGQLAEIILYIIPPESISNVTKSYSGAATIEM